MAKILYDYYDGKDIYTDGEAEGLLLEHFKEDKGLDYYTEGVWYLTTDIRSNILEWYPFKKSDSILEIGSGCGTITGLLCEKAGNVTSIEASKRRAEITYERNKEYKDLEVIVGNYGTFEFKRKFDYIVLVGVFEYAKRFFPEKDSYSFFLSEMKKNLKKDGKILIAIENRYGIKYWAGAREDHLLEPFVGLENYEGTDIATFGKTEFINLIERFGFSKYKFYYPFPDYKLPEVIYTDSTLPKYSEVSKIPIYLYDSLACFDIYNVLRGISANKMLDFFANSFLIEFGSASSVPSSIDYVKYQNYREKRFQLSTIIDGKGNVIKKPLYKEGRDHLYIIDHIYHEARKENLNIVHTKRKGDILVSEFVKGKKISSVVGELVNQGNKLEIIKAMDGLFAFLKSLCVKKKFERPIINDLNRIYKKATYIPRLSLMDLNSNNILLTADGYVAIDQEWLTADEIPLDYLISNSIFEIYECNPNLSLLISIDFFLKRYKITESKIKAFERISKEYFEKEQGIFNKGAKEILEGCSYKKTDLSVKSIDDFIEDLDRLIYFLKSEDNKIKVSDQIRSLTNYLPILESYSFEKKFYLFEDKDEYIYLPNKPCNSGKESVLLMTHELSRTGAPVVLVDAAKILFDHGYFVTILSLIDGPLRKELLDYGIPVIISEEMHKIQYNNYNAKINNILLDKVVSSFDKVLMCTATLINFVRRYDGIDKKIIWWLHEGPESWKAIGHLMPKDLGDNIKVFCGGQYVVDKLKDNGLNYRCQILNYGVVDQNITRSLFADNEKVKFLIVGTICKRKGQLILMEAIDMLPDVYKNKAEFIFIGSPYPSDTFGLEIQEKIEELILLNPNVQIISDIPRENLYNYYKEGDALIVPSLDDPMPVVATESLMFGNICICSNMTGTSYYIKDGQNGFVFKSENAKELLDKIVYVIKNYSHMDKLRERSRKIYEENFSIQEFESNLIKIISKMK